MKARVKNHHPDSFLSPEEHFWNRSASCPDDELILNAVSEWNFIHRQRRPHFIYLILARVDKLLHPLHFHLVPSRLLLSNSWPLLFIFATSSSEASQNDDKTKNCKRRLWHNVCHNKVIDVPQISKRRVKSRKLKRKNASNFWPSLPFFEAVLLVCTAR